MKNHALEKTLWSTADFDLMGWHDSSIYGLSLISDFDTKADGFEQYVRQLPIYSKSQQLSLTVRGGISFEKVQATR